MMRLAALIPVKGFDFAKQRLSGVLTPIERRDLARNMLTDTIALAKSTSIITDIFVATGDADVLSLAKTSQLNVSISNSSLDLNETINKTAKQLAQEHYDRILVLPTDLPLATADDLSSLVAAHVEFQDHLTIAVAQKDFGTNCLVMAPPASMDVCFGTLSGLRHLESAQSHGLQAHALSLPGLDLDIDDPTDICKFLKLAKCGNAWNFLMHIRLLERLVAGTPRGQT
ncbi:2-phospho-L-lactate guanylyltransferase [Pseudorhodoplanes sp.]|uniref:2-phospho-L-lactate guanylyltransferase n=1 Tax=Pseudorhodoplanes sp. TaxID=1934341 RepID=UPI003D145064